MRIGGWSNRTIVRWSGETHSKGRRCACATYVPGNELHAHLRECDARACVCACVCIVCQSGSASKEPPSSPTVRARARAPQSSITSLTVRAITITQNTRLLHLEVELAGLEVVGQDAHVGEGGHVEGGARQPPLPAVAHQGVQVGVGGRVGWFGCARVVGVWVFGWVGGRPSCISSGEGPERLGAQHLHDEASLSSPCAVRAGLPAMPSPPMMAATEEVTTKCRRSMPSVF